MEDPVWSVLILLSCGLAFTLYCIYYILRLAHKEVKNGEMDLQGGGNPVQTRGQLKKEVKNETSKSDTINHKSKH
jgi:type III secretory pathway component EscU